MSDQQTLYPGEEGQEPSYSPIPVQSRGSEPEAPRPEPASVTEKPSRKSLLAQEAQTLSEIIASLGGATAGRLKLCVQRNVRGIGWKSLRAIQIEEWMIENGLDVPEVVGEAYGDGFYRWQLRYAGRFLRKGDCHLEGYEHVRDDAIPPPDDEELPQLDLTVVLEQFRKEVREEIRAASPAPQALSGQGDQLKAVMEPLMRFLESKFPGQPTRPQGPDPTVTALISMMAQQTNTFMQVMAQGMTHAPAASPTLTENVRVIKEIMEVARGLSTPQFVPYEEAPFEETPEFSMPPAEQPAQGSPILDQLGKSVTAAANRLLTNLVQAGEEKLSKEVTQMVAQAGSPEASDTVALAPERIAEYEALFAVLDGCVQQGIPPETVARSLAESLPPDALRQLAAEGMSAERLTEISALLGKPEITQKLRQPAFQAYLTRLIELFRAHPGAR